jgi:integrase
MVADSTVTLLHPLQHRTIAGRPDIAAARRAGRQASATRAPYRPAPSGQQQPGLQATSPDGAALTYLHGRDQRPEYVKAASWGVIPERAIQSWTVDEAKRFLTASRPDPFYAAFVLLVLCGLRRGEVLGLGWSDIDFDTGAVHIRQQIQRIRHELVLGPVKTHAGRRTLPLLDPARQALQLQAERQATYRIAMGSAWPETDLVFTTRTGRPVEPRNLVRSFRRICDDNKIRIITVHHLRHTVASLLKDLHVPVRDAQVILGHARISTTLEIYTDTADQAQRDALTRLHGVLDEAQK